ncbi:MAG: hypothetical protein M9963_11810 [Kiritimatiellae bacterium]|nr:hypothetical protein [Kiritimatiellia bacterium]MCO5062656.1 hypothetical protein [Kiritimatiellia bacterium]MCO6401815.1 hypothetical protein [Verrucomicrobiota bacterium]
MSGTDFFDDDLVRQRDTAQRIKMGPGDEPAESASSLLDADLPARAVSDFNLTRMARHRKEVDTQSALAAQELDRLRKRQEQLEAEKRELEDLRKRQDDYERGKREMTEHFKRSLVTLERKEVDAQRMVELLGATRLRFKEQLSVIESLQEEGWHEGEIRDELGRSLSVLEQARMEYNKAMAKIDAAKPEAPPAAAAGQRAVVFDDHAIGADEDKSFTHWVKIGFAVSLPLVVVILILGLMFFFANWTGVF